MKKLARRVGLSFAATAVAVGLVAAAAAPSQALRDSDWRDSDWGPARTFQSQMDQQ